MPNKTNLTLRMEPDLKAQAAALFKELGMDLSTATGIFYRQALRCHGLPFAVTMDPPKQTVSREKMLADADQILDAFAEDYQRMAE